ncbi:lactadherin-like [Acropora palmata]|uniref:lactadherin-like n=1 Tax=Acropora palmata TaxID=6131 RepID=UPI003DA14F43
MQNYLDLTLFFSSLFFTIAAGFSAECRTSFSNKDHVLIGHVMRTLKSKSFEKCTFSCELDSRCFSVNYFLWDKTCELNNASANSSPGHLVSRKGVVCIDMVIRKDDPCVSMRCGNGGTCVVSSKVQCNCVQGFIGPRCENLQDALGMESGYIKNEQITAASAKQGFDAWKGRLNGESCWIPGRLSSTEYISVTFSSAKTIKAIAMQGAPKQDCWVTTYKVEWQYGDSSSVFQKLFKGNNDKNTVVINNLTPAINATVVHIFPQNWSSCVAMRLELCGF